jgi:rSAM/selenodomain-associated transferase 1
VTRSRLVVFGRQPIPGRVKTRLACTVGADVAAAIYDVLLEHTLSRAVATGVPVVLMLDRQPTPEWRPPVPVAIDVQCPGDLGARMHEALQRQFRAGVERAAVVGSDCAELRTEHLVDGVDALGIAPVVLGPAGDGGYWLVAQREPGVDVFAGVPWSSPSTLAVTRELMRRTGVRWHELEELSDVDTVEDLRQVVERGRADAEVTRRLATFLPAP